MSSSELQKIVVARLRNRVTLVGGRVYDSPPKDAELPYITIGSSDAYTDDSECSDGIVETMQIDVWASALPNKSLVKDIVMQTVGALRRYQIPEDSPLRAGPFRVVQTRILGDPDPAIVHGVVQFEVFIEDG